MATSIAGIWDQRSTAHAATSARAADSQPTGTSGNSASDSASISANDFLTLLVTEMQNQDPTAATDPNEYINQLVQVNSLEQLISINQTLTADSVAASGDASRSPSASHDSVLHNANAAAQPGALPPFPSMIPSTAGNLTTPEANPAAMRVAQSLAGQPKGH